MSFFSLKRTKKQTKTGLKKSISVVVYAKNNTKDLEKNIPNWLTQTHSNFEILILDHASRDISTLELVRGYEKTHPGKIRYIPVAHVEAFWASKKYALTLGVKAAKHEHIVYTSATSVCDKHWLDQLCTSFKEEKEIIVGYAAIAKEKKSFLNILQRFDALIENILQFNAVHTGMYFNADQDNMAFTKATFFKSNGYIDHIDIHPGHDRLLIHQNGSRKNTAYNITKNVYKPAKRGWRSWLESLRISFFVQQMYQKNSFYLSVCFIVSKVVLISSFLLLLQQQQYLFLTSILFAIYYFIYIILLSIAAKKLNELRLIWWFPILEITLILTQITSLLYNKTGHPKRWKLQKNI